MSFWCYVTGTVTVRPMGRTQAEKRYILDTVLEHLPLVTGSERDMNVYVIQKNGYSSSCSHDEFGEITNNLVDSYGDRSRERGSLKTQDEYILVVDGSFRDRKFDQTYREFVKWLCRLGKRIRIEDVLVEVKEYGKSTIIKNTNIQSKKYSYRKVFNGLFEDPSWCNDTGELNWCEYLLWDRAKKSDYPILLGYKYFADEENDKEAERRIRYGKD